MDIRRDERAEHRSAVQAWGDPAGCDEGRLGAHGGGDDDDDDLDEDGDDEDDERDDEA